MNAMKYHLTSAQKQIISERVAQEIRAQMSSYLLNYDAMWLWSAARTFGFGKARLEKMYREFYEHRREDKDFYECNGYEGLLESEAIKGLRDIGVDLIGLAEQYSEAVVETEVTK